MPYPKNKKHTKEHSEKISKALTGIKRSKETCRKMSLYHIGRKLSEETKQKIRDNRKGKGMGNTNGLGKNLGEKNHLWKGGISRLPYSLDWTKTLKISIRERDNYICQICNKKQIYNKEKRLESLSVHHIDYNKQNCNPDNLVSLCRNCHRKTNENREYWIEYFKLWKNKIDYLKLLPQRKRFST